VSGSSRSLPSVFDLAFLTGEGPKGELILVRHGEQDIPDRTAASVGTLVDPPLSARGQRQAALVGQRLAGLPVDAVYSSRLARARDTGAAIGSHHGVTPVELDDLEEIRLFRGVPPELTPLERYGPTVMMGVRDRFLRERRWDAYPDSEHGSEFRSRVVRVIDGIVTSHPEQRVVVACHGGVINTYLGHHIGVPHDMWFRPAHTAVHVVLHTGAVRSLRSINDHGHLPPELVTH
jgi:2,3-bisphosphoglycerate-dependent phosphoglycerate mutase